MDGWRETKLISRTLAHDTTKHKERTEAQERKFMVFISSYKLGMEVY
jgi:hypothetical protein